MTAPALHPRIALPRTGVPTTDASAFRKALQAARAEVGLPTFDFGQGALRRNPSDELRRMLAGDVSLPSVAYQTVGGGPMEVREVVANWFKSILGVPAAADNTFIFSRKHGRQVLHFVTPNEGRAIIAENRWPTIDSHIYRKGKWALDEYGYDEFDKGREFARQGIADDFYLCNPSNPLSQIMKRIELELLMDDLDHGKTTLKQDYPYFYAFKDMPKGSAHELDSGMDLQRRDSNMPWIAMFSGSKALGMADRGLTVVVCSDNMIPLMKHLCTIYGMAYEMNEMEGLRQAMLPENIPTWMQHFRFERENHGLCRGTLEKTFADVEGVDLLPGEAGMTALLKVANYRHIEVPGIEAPVVADALEEMGNTEGVVVVDNGANRVGDRLIRITQAEEHGLFTQGMGPLRRSIERTFVLR